MKILATILLLLAPAVSLAADATVPHCVILNAPYPKVVKVLSGSRSQLVQASGAQLVKVSGNSICLSCKGHTFWVTESKRLLPPARVIVTWDLSQPTDKIAAYHSDLDCYATAGNKTVVRGTVTVSVGDKKIGSNKLEKGVRDGVAGMESELKLLTER